MLIDRRNLTPHVPWIVAALAAFAGASLWYFLAAASDNDWPGGSSGVGFALGVVGGLIILFEFFLWPRKALMRTWRLGRAQVWMRAHIWLGLLTVPLLVYHSGFRFGGTLSTVLMVLLFVVVASGVWGLVLQNLLPRRLLEEVPAETIYSQIDRISHLMDEEAERLVLATCGPENGELAAVEREETAVGFLTIGAVRTAGRVQGKVLQTRVPRSPVPGSEPLRVFFTRAVRPYLRGEAAADSPLRAPGRAAVAFQDLRIKLPPAAHDAVDALENLCEQRRQFDRQAWLHFWLHNWLWIHLPLSVALVVLMILHIVVALKYW